MHIGNIEVKRRVWVALACALGVTGPWWVWTRARLPAATVLPPVKQPFVRLTGAGATMEDQALRERAELMDPTPLFFPTEWNYGQRPLREGILKQPGQVFGSFPAKRAMDEQNISLYGEEPVEVPIRPADILAQGDEAPFGGIGQIDSQRSSLQVRGGYLEVRSLDNDHAIISQQLTGILPPRSDYAPVEFLVLVGSAGLIGEPILTSGSGWDEVDNFFRAYLVKSYRLGERLRPGQYRVSVGA